MTREEDKAIKVDCYELVNKSVESHMRPFIEATMHEHQVTRQKVENVEALIRKLTFNVHDVVQYSAIILLFFGMLLLITGG